MNGEFYQAGAFTPIMVRNFCLLDPASLKGVCADLSLSALVPYLARTQQYFRLRELRDPFVHELLFLERLAAALREDPAAIRVSSVHATDGELRAFGDMLSKWQTLGKATPPSLLDMMQLGSQYLARSGIKADPLLPLFATASDKLAARAGVDAAAGALRLGNVTATLSPGTESPFPMRGAALLLSAGDAQDAPALYSSFLDSYRQYGITPIAAVGNEGVFPHLLSCPGIAISVPGIASGMGVDIPDVRHGANSLLFTAPEHLVPALFATGAPITLLGSLMPTGRIRISMNARDFTSPELSFLRSLQAVRVCTLTAKEPAACDTPTPALTKHSDTVLGGLCVSGRSDEALLCLAGDVYCAGGDLTRCALSAVLELPFGADTKELGTALGLVFGLHRAVCELTLPMASAQLARADIPAPRLSMFLAAGRSSTPRTNERPYDMQAARALFFG